jgi:hypothetical protein
LLGTVWWYTNAVLRRLILPLQNLRIAIMVGCGHGDTIDVRTAIAVNAWVLDEA